MGPHLEAESRHAVAAQRVAGAPDGRWVAVQGSFVTLVHPGGTTELPEAPGHHLGAIFFSDDAEQLLAAPFRWRFDVGEWLGAAPVLGTRDSRLLASCWAPDGLGLAWAEDDRAAHRPRVVWRDDRGTSELPKTEHWSTVACMLVTPERSGRCRVIAASALIEAWDPSSAAAAWSTEPGRWQVNRLVVSDGAVVAGDAGGGLVAYEGESGAPVWSAVTDSAVTGLAATAHGVVAASREGKLTLYDSAGSVMDMLVLDGPVCDLAACGPTGLLAAHAGPEGVTAVVVGD